MASRPTFTGQGDDSTDTATRVEVSPYSRATATGVEVSPYSTDPHKAWHYYAPRLVIKTVKPLSPATPLRPDAVRFVCISDTHTKVEKLLRRPDKHVRPVDIPPGDVLLHAGDFTLLGQADRVVEFNKFLGTLPHTHKVVIAGNHELSFDKGCEHRMSGPYRAHNQSVLTKMGVSHVRDLLTNCVYLEDMALEIYGIKIYGSPWQPAFREWAFNVPRGRPAMDIWDKIPSDTDVLMTHGPPLGYGDELTSGGRAGCVDLLNTVQQRVRPLYHVFGHIHEGYGVYSDGHTTYINASTCTTRYFPTNRPVVFDIPLKDYATSMRRPAPRATSPQTGPSSSTSP